MFFLEYKNKLIGGILAACMMLTALTSAGSAVIAADDGFESVAAGHYFGAELLPSGVDADTLHRRLSDAVISCSPTAELADLGITDDSASAIAEMIAYSIPEAFHIERISYETDRQDNITRMHFKYSMTAEAYKAKLDECEAAADRMTADLVDSALSDAEKTLLVHDRIAAACEYDYSGYTDYIQGGKDMPADDFSIYGVLVSGKAVCEGYALTNIYLLSRLGIQAMFCRSSQINHGWNIVWLDNIPYHVDITWDDAVWDITGRVDHQYFLLSSSALESRRAANGAAADDYYTFPDDTTYDGYYWQSSNAAFQYVGGVLYYIDNKRGELISLGDETKTIAELDGRWAAGKLSTWSGNFSRLASYGSSLYYSTPDSIYRYDTETGVIERFYEPDLSVGKYFGIYGLSVFGNELVYDINDSPNFTESTKANYEYRIPLKRDTEPTEEMAGDINGDKTVDTSDLIRLMKYISGSNVVVYVPDVNGDGYVNVSDLVRLVRYIAGQDVELVAAYPKTEGAA